MRLRMLMVPAALLVVALPAQANAGRFSGTVVAKQKQRGTLLLAGAHGVGVTVRGGLARTAVGERIRVQGIRLHDGTIRLSRLDVLGRVHTALVRGTVVRTVARGTLLASGRSVVMIRRSGRRLASAADHGGLRAGVVEEFRIRFGDDDDLVESGPPAQVGQAGSVQIEGSIVTVSPLVVSLDGLPLTIGVPSGVALPSTLVPGQRIGLTVDVGAANTFTLVAVDEAENVNPVAEGQEVEVKGVVTSSTATEVVVSANGLSFTFVAPAGSTLPTVPLGVLVEVRGVQQNGVITLTRLRSDDEGGEGGGSSGSGGGSDDGGRGGGH
ncbi:MAG TPA: hypothetical protein VFB25_05500 [Gaiellaceae bacterium]|nr:hypothetical protein [Gaiellaceae bacterium]